MTHAILVPLDGSSFAEAALPMAVALARRWPATLHLLTVEEPIIPIPAPPYEDAARRWASDYLDEMRRQIEALGALDAVPVTHVATGEEIVPDAIDHHARSAGSDLIVLATHGHGPLSRFWLGSVADGLIRQPGPPLLLVRPEEEEQPALDAPVSLEHVLVPLDGSSTAEGTLESVKPLAERSNSRLTLLRLVRYPTEAVSAYLPDTATAVAELVAEGETAAREYLDEVAGRLREEGLTVETRVRTVHSVARGILHEADELDVDLIAIATRGHGGLTRIVLGSVADKVLRGTHHPMLITRAGHDD